VLMTPYLVKDIRAHNLSVVESAHPEQLSTVLDSSLDQDLIGMMRDVVSKGTGTAAQIGIPGVVVAGKTGTADNGPQDANGNYQNAPHAWFSGFSLYNGNPKIAVSVIVENGGVNGNETTGGKAAAPIAKDVMTAYLNSIGIR
jgi:peptidoglycan glycosyltransferase